MTILNKLQNEADKHGYTFEKSKFNGFFWIKADSCFYLDGYKTNYDIRGDYGNKYSHDIYEIVNELCRNLYGNPDEVHTPNMDKTGDSYWGTSFQRWCVGNIQIVNYMYGHPKSGFFNTCLYINYGKLDCEAK